MVVATESSSSASHDFESTTEMQAGNHVRHADCEMKPCGIQRTRLTTVAILAAADGNAVALMFTSRLSSTDEFQKDAASISASASDSFRSRTCAGAI
jgi:hypothetical protein